MKYYVPYNCDTMTHGPEFISIELTRQWIRENWDDDVDATITYGRNFTFKYYRDLASTGILGDDGFLTLTDERRGPTFRWNPSTGEYGSKHPDSFVPYSKFSGAGIGEQLASLETRILTPYFEYLESTHTIVRSFHVEPTILPYELLGNSLPPDEPTPEQLKKYDIVHWVAKFITCTTTCSMHVSITIEWPGGIRGYLLDVLDVAFVHVTPVIYENGIVLHIIPTNTDSFPGNAHKHSTVMVLDK